AQPANLSYNAVGKLTDVKATLEGGTNITAIGHLDIKGSAQDKSVINLKGMKSGSAGHTDSLAYIGGSKKLTIDNTTINVKDGSDKSESKGTAVVSPDLQITNSKIVVAGANDTLTLGGLADRNSVGGTTGLTSGDYTADTATIKNSNISITSGTLNLGHEANDLQTKTSFNLTGNTIQNKGVINAYGDVSVDKVAGLFDSGSGDTTGRLNLSGSTFVVTGANESIDLSKANIKADAKSKSELVVENGSITIAKGFEGKVGNVKAGTIVVSGGISDNPKKHYGVPSGAYYLNFTGSADITAFNELKGSQKNTVLQLNPGSDKTAKLTLRDSAGSKGELKDILRVQVGIAQTSGKSTLDVHGTWDFNNAGLYVAKGGVATIHEGASITNVERLKVEDGSNTKIYGTANINRLLSEASNSKGQVNVHGTLNIRGDDKKDGPSSSGNYTNDVYLKSGTLTIHAGGTVSLAEDAWDDVLDVKTDSDTGISTFTVSTDGNNSGDNGAWNKESVTLNAGGTLRIDLSGYKVADKKAVEDLAQALIVSGSKGLVDLGGIGIGSITTNQDGTINLDNMPNVKTETTQNLEVNLGNATSLDKSYSMGSANVSGNSLTIGTGSTVEFNKAKNGQFATNKDAAAAADSKVNVTLSKDSALNLNGDGSLGDIKKNASDSGTAVVLGGNNGTQTVGEVQVERFNQVGGNVTTGAITATGATTVKGVLNARGDVSTNTLVLTSGAIKAGDNSITVTEASQPAKIFGDVEASSLSLSGGATIAGGADVKLDSLKGATGTTIQVGDDAEGGLGATVLVGSLDLQNGTIFVDPAYGGKASLVIAESLSGVSTPNDTDAGTLNGNAIVGNNAALGIGFASEAELKAVVGSYLDANGSFTETPDAAKNQLANALVVNKKVTVGLGKGITLQKGATTSTPVAGNTIDLGAGTGLIVTDNAFTKGADGSKTGPAIQIDHNDGKVTAAAGSSVVLVGDFTAADKNLTIFGDKQNGVTVTGTANVVAAGGLLSGTLAANGSIASLALDPDAEKAIRSEVSAPVGQLFVDFANGKFDGATGAGYDFLVDAISGKQFKAVDAAAHAATYAGAQQAAVVSVTTMADAMFGRVGAVGVEAASIAATGSQANGGVWLTPMYKSMDADGFNAEGVSYGSDVDAAGVAFGADTVNGNMRFGAVFNIGSGDTEGKGQGNGLKDEFDYYGFGIYSAMGFGNFALVGDASLTVISHEVEGLGLRGKADTTAVTMGLTGQYTVATPAVDVTPHLGARFIRLNTDSYDLIGADGAIATTDFDVQNVFSVPLGVTLSKAFVAGGWTLAPSADLTVTFNAGDTEAKSTTTFSGIAHGINMNTEVLDEVQYGLTVGLGAQYGAFGTSFGINYTGSSNTDSFGVNAQARYMF
ncbi:MAG: autotransporter outer membrane beta-barrel domain-containing protein, partial [Anaerobiospirillum succiniciproducens]|uniref:autotransporter outer membrane beta-barrel domain-containing protein n=1 Tax=Anaerobiospirillum succiniciproducens TaxID=13335 RepID=UPI002A75955A